MRLLLSTLHLLPILSILPTTLADLFANITTTNNCDSPVYAYTGPGWHPGDGDPWEVIQPNTISFVYINSASDDGWQLLKFTGLPPAAAPAQAGDDRMEFHFLWAWGHYEYDIKIAGGGFLYTSGEDGEVKTGNWRLRANDWTLGTGCTAAAEGKGTVIAWMEGKKICGQSEPQRTGMVLDFCY